MRRPVALALASAAALGAFVGGVIIGAAEDSTLVPVGRFVTTPTIVETGYGPAPLGTGINDAIIVRVIDGDTLIADIDLGYNVHLDDIHIRLDGIDAPEPRSRNPIEKAAGLAAQGWLQNELPMGSDVAIVATEQDSFGRWLAVVYEDGTNMNEALVAAGHAEESE